MTPTPSRASFLASVYGSQFNSAEPALIDSALATAARRTSTYLQSADLITDHVFLKAAIILLRHPKSYPMRLANPDQLLTWERELKLLQRSGTVGLRTF